MEAKKWPTMAPPFQAAGGCFANELKRSEYLDEEEPEYREICRLRPDVVLSQAGPATAPPIIVGGNGPQALELTIALEANWTLMSSC